MLLLMLSLRMLLSVSVIAVVFLSSNFVLTYTIIILHQCFCQCQFKISVSASSTALLVQVQSTPCVCFQVWFQNKRSKERRMKQLSNGMGMRFFGGKTTLFNSIYEFINQVHSEILVMEGAPGSRVTLLTSFLREPWASSDLIQVPIIFTIMTHDHDHHHHHDLFF